MKRARGASRKAVRIPRRARDSRGVILIVGLLFLLAITLLSLAMARGQLGQGKIAGNTLDKQRSFEAAQSALNYGEWWVNNNASGLNSTPCATPNGALSTLTVCDTALATPATLPWAAWTAYQPASMSVQAGGGLAATGDINYQTTPGLYVSFLGHTPDGQGVLYQVTAFSGGGRYETASVVQSTYRLQAPAKDLGGA